MMLIYIYFAIFVLQNDIFIKADFQNEGFQDERAIFLDSINFRGKVALITGSNSGLGAATVRLLSALGAQVVVTGRNESRIQQVAAECKKLSPYNYNPLAIQADLYYENNRQKLVDETIKRFKRIDILVNFAGIAKFNTLQDPLYSQTCNEMTVINQQAVMDIVRFAGPYLLKTNGTIINIASVLSHLPLLSVACYSTIKGGQISFTESVTTEFSPNVRVNVISPGLIEDTLIFRYIGGLPPALRDSFIGATSLKRGGVPRDIANVVAFLASSLGSFINGRNIQVDGGVFVPLHG